ncbi:MAG: hypothetical protein JXA18_17500 [Chitinispirillaceae bacterium]|nr:hypothetical protein [Chitinispirillaceae bacterium]
MKQVLLHTINCSTLLATVLLSPCCSCADSGRKPVARRQPLVRTITSVDEMNSIITTAGERLLMFDLYADWCMPCRILSPMLEKIATEQKDKVTVYKINIDTNPEIAGALGVSGIPFVVFVKNREGVYALSGVQSKDTYIRVINRFAGVLGAPEDVTPGGELIGGIRIVKLSTAATPGDIYVYRGETVKLIIDRVEFPYAISIPAFGISREGRAGESLEVTFKAEEIGVYPVFCNGDCPAGDGSRYGRIIVMQYKSTGKAQFAELSVEDAVTLIAEKKPLILDVRTPKEYYAGHIEAAKLIPLQQLDQRVSELSAYKDRDILVYCRSGNRSTVASQILIRNGFKKLYNLRRGVVGWEKAGQKMVK